MLRPETKSGRHIVRENTVKSIGKKDTKPAQIPTANPWLAAVEPSPIAETKRWVLGRTFAADSPLIDLSQAVPGYPPALELRRHLGELLLDPTMHGYTPTLGLPALRQRPEHGDPAKAAGTTRAERQKTDGHEGKTHGSFG